MHKADLHHTSDRLQQKLEAIYRLRRTTTKVNWDQDGFQKLLQKMGSPHLKLPAVIHVAGTNGKGSVVAFLRSVFEESGYKVHAYTSPHLIKVNERIVLGGADISDAYLEDLIDDVMALNDGDPLSFFEIMTAVAFKAFSSVPADVVLLEVGMGGRLDCTNVVPHPIVSIINRISMDHTEFLGGTIVDIAREKAGIIKENVPCVLGYQGDGDSGDRISAVVRQVGLDAGIHVVEYDLDYSFDIGLHGLSVRISEEVYDIAFPKMVGIHQYYNAALAVAAISQIRDRFSFTQEQLSRGIAKANWIGRLQRVDVTALSRDGALWVDCGHNDSAGQALAQQLECWAAEGTPCTTLVVGMLGTKDYMNFLSPILSYIDDVYVVPLSFDPQASRSFNDFKAAISRDFSDVDVTYGESALDAIKKIFLRDSGARVLLCGSVYLVGELLDALA